MRRAGLAIRAALVPLRIVRLIWRERSLIRRQQQLAAWCSAGLLDAMDCADRAYDDGDDQMASAWAYNAAWKTIVARKMGRPVEIRSRHAALQREVDRHIRRHLDDIPALAKSATEVVFAMIENPDARARPCVPDRTARVDAVRASAQALRDCRDAGPRRDRPGTRARARRRRTAGMRSSARSGDSGDDGQEPADDDPPSGNRA